MDLLDQLTAATSLQRLLIANHCSEFYLLITTNHEWTSVMHVLLGDVM